MSFETFIRHSKNLKRLTIRDKRERSILDLLPSIKHKLLQNLVYLDITLEEQSTFRSTFREELEAARHAGLQISSLNKNLRYLRLSGLFIQLNTKGRDPCIEKCVMSQFVTARPNFYSAEFPLCFRIYLGSITRCFCME